MKLSYRALPEWQEAQCDYTDEAREEESPQDVLNRSMAATRRMFEIETQYSGK